MGVSWVSHGCFISGPMQRYRSCYLAFFSYFFNDSSSRQRITSERGHLGDDPMALGDGWLMRIKRKYQRRNKPTVKDISNKLLAIRNMLNAS